MKLLDRFFARSKPEEAVETPDAPERHAWVLTVCRECMRVAWYAMPIPHVATTNEEYEQFVRMNQGGHSSRRVKVKRPMMLVMGRPEHHVLRCAACGSTDLGGAKTATERLQLIQFAMRREA